MKRALLTALVLALSLHGMLNAQQGGSNRSVLPAKSDPPDLLKTDEIAQKQVEGSHAFSTRNYLHGMFAYIDFRAVILAEEGIGEQALNRSVFKGVLARLLGRPKPRERSVRAALPEAWIGTSFTYDGVTTSGGFLPGGPFDNSPASMASPVKQLGYQAATDPWVTSAPAVPGERGRDRELRGPEQPGRTAHDCVSRHHAHRHREQRDAWSLP